jgi:hypothetical protein
MNRIRRRTHCVLPGHGTRCEAAHDGRDGRYCRATEKHHAMRHEQEASR